MRAPAGGRRGAPRSARAASTPHRTARGVRSDHGMGLIEVIVGLGLVALCIIGMNALVVSMTRGNLSARLIDQASRLAAAKINDLRKAGYDKAPVGTTTDLSWSAGAGTGVIFVRTTTVASGALSDLRAVTVTMSWNDRGERRSVFATEIAK